MAVCAAMFSACADDESFSTSRSDVLAFSVDSVRLDTTFSNVPTPTASCWVYNRSGKGIRCSSVRLENGNQTASVSMWMARISARRWAIRRRMWR